MVKDTAGNYSLSGITDNEPVTIETNNEIEYFLQGPHNVDDKRGSASITRQIQKEFEDLFMAIECFGGTFTLQVKPYSNHTRHHHDMWHTHSRNHSRRS